MANRILGGHYAIERQLGKQTGRRTLLARDLRTRELVVIKLLSLGNDFEWQHLKLFEREAETLKSLSHPSIPRYLDYLELDSPKNKGFALVQSYVEGKTLEEHLKAGRTFSAAEVKELAKALLEILIYLHGHQPPVIHRDIKPSNILLGDRSGNTIGQVYLVDFGSVQTLAAREGGTITVVATYGYMPPEQFGGRATPASDLYSLGATLIYLVTGLHPTELLQQDFRIQFQQVAKLEPSFVDWLEWMTEPSLERRLSSATKALQALEKPRRRNKAIAINQAASRVGQLPDSEVVLTKTADFLEIILPPKGLNFHSIMALSLMVPWLLTWGTLTLLPVIWSFYIVTIGFLLLTSTPLLRWILFDLFVRVRLRIDRKQISLTNDLFGLKWNRLRPIPIQNISELELTNGYVTGIEEESWTDELRLIVRAGKQEYELIGKRSSLSELEVNWLAKEISDRLGVQITNPLDWLNLP